MPVDLAFPTPQLQYMDEPTYADYLPNFLNKAWEVARTNIEEAQKEYQRRYNEKSQAHPFKKGDQLLIHTPQPRKGISPKLQRPWHGPYKVLEATPQIVQVQPQAKTPRRGFTSTVANQLHTNWEVMKRNNNT